MQRTFKHKKGGLTTYKCTTEMSKILHAKSRQLAKWGNIEALLLYYKKYLIYVY